MLGFVPWNPALIFCSWRLVRKLFWGPGEMKIQTMINRCWRFEVRIQFHRFVCLSIFPFISAVAYVSVLDILSKKALVVFVLLDWFAATLSLVGVFFFAVCGRSPSLFPFISADAKVSVLLILSKKSVFHRLCDGRVSETHEMLYNSIIFIFHSNLSSSYRCLLLGGNFFRCPIDFPFKEIVEI